jgi:chorismate synthase
MTHLHYLIAGESHGPGIVATLEGLPANVILDKNFIDSKLKERQQGYGRGGRQKIETDQVDFLSGVRHGKSLGGPITSFIKNKDYENWSEVMNPLPVNIDPQKLKEARYQSIHQPRPGHADLAGAQKYHQTDIRNILERASARDTCARVAIGAICMEFLKNFGISFDRKILFLGNVPVNSKTINAQAEKAIDAAREAKTTLGGIYEITVTGVPVGLGSFVTPERKLDGRIAQQIMSIQAHKGVQIGDGFEAAMRTGHEAHDAIVLENKKIKRVTNHAGGIEGGMSNGETIVVKAAMKPIATLYRPLPTVDLQTMQAVEAHIERSDICALEAATVIGESAVAFVIAQAFLEKFGGDSLEEVVAHFRSYRPLYS